MPLRSGIFLGVEESDLNSESIDGFYNEVGLYDLIITLNWWFLIFVVVGCFWPLQTWQEMIQFDI